MKIKEIGERDCCDRSKGDLAPYFGLKPDWMLKTYFCKFCGQLWVEDSRRDVAGGKYLRKILANDDGIIRA